MKKLCIAALLPVFLITFSANAQITSYPDECLKVELFVKTNAKTKINFNIAADGTITPVPGADVTNFEADLLAAATASGKDKEDIRQEFAYMVFLYYDDSPADLKKVAGKLPVQFKLADNNALGITNADQGTTSYTNLQSSIIYGLTDFIISRAKEEMVEVYLGKWYTKLNNDTLIQPLIPQTLSVFKAFIDDNSISLASYGDKFKSAFQKDLGNLPLQFEKEDYVDKLLVKAGLPNTSEIGPVVAGGDRIAYELSQKSHLVNILSGMSADYLKENKPADFKKLVVLSNALLTAAGQMNDKNTTYVPVSVSSLKQMDITDWHLLLKLLYVRMNTALNYALTAADLDAFYNTYLTGANADDFIALFSQTENLISAYQNGISSKPSQSIVQLSANDVEKLMELSFQLMDNMEGYRQLFKPDATAKKTYESDVKPYFTYLSQIGQGLQSQQYANVLDGTLGVVNLIDKASAKPPATSGNLSGTLQLLQKYGSFMLNILSAKSPGDVQAALEELVPKGDYKLKNAPNFTISLSAFPGVSAGFEQVSKFPSDPSTGDPLKSQPKQSSTAFSPGVYLPIGIDFNWGSAAKGNLPTNPAYYSWGILVQAVDLGSVLSYRVSSDQAVDAAPNITFKQLLSPGIAITHHFINSPLVIGGALNYAPDLREINQNGNTYSSNSLRFGLFLAIDVTFFNFSIKSL